MSEQWPQVQLTITAVSLNAEICQRNTRTFTHLCVCEKEMALRYSPGCGWASEEAARVSVAASPTITDAREGTWSYARPKQRTHKICNLPRCCDVTAPHPPVPWLPPSRAQLLRPHTAECMAKQEQTIHPRGEHFRKMSCYRNRYSRCCTKWILVLNEMLFE